MYDLDRQNEMANPITPDGSVGFDKYDQFTIRWREGDSIISQTVPDVRTHTCYICNRGWETTAESLRDQWPDHVFKRCVHYTCQKGAIRWSDATFWHDVACSEEARPTNAPLTIHEIENEYGSCWNNPWYQITYEDIPLIFVVGYRKRVWSLHIRGTLVPRLIQELDTQFKAEEVTKNFGQKEAYIHAWGNNDARRYFVVMTKAIRSYASVFI